MEAVPLIEANNLAVRYPNGELALHDVTFSIKSPSFMADLSRTHQTVPRQYQSQWIRFPKEVWEDTQAREICTTTRPN